MKWTWWKILAIVLVSYTVIGGLLMEVPRLFILNETIRNLYFHVPMWFGMVFLLAASVFYSIKHLKGQEMKHDVLAVETANVGVFFGILGLLTGMVWAKFTWGSYWSGDPKQNASAVGMLIYLAYFILRGSFKDTLTRGRISAVYNIFAFSVFVPLIFILPRLTDSLHPGNGGNPGFNAYDLDSNLRLVFYPAVIGWILLGTWICNLRARIRQVELAHEDL